MICKIYNIALPYYKMAEDISPLSHIDIVLDIATEIAEGENLNPVDTNILKISALLHDIGLSAVKKEPKIVESDIEKADKDKKSELIRKACNQRAEHMICGSDIARMILTENAEFIFESDIDEICRLIRNHDNVKIAKMRKDAKYLNDKEDWLLQLLNEADALWMLTQEGLRTDILRGSGFSYKQQLEWNINQHRKVYNIYNFYNRVCGYGFKEKTLYRSNTGYNIFRRLANV